MDSAFSSAVSREFLLTSSDASRHLLMASAQSSSPWKRNPLTPSSMMSWNALASQQATGSPQAIASRTESPWVSNLDADTSMSEAA